MCMWATHRRFINQQSTELPHARHTPGTIPLPITPVLEEKLTPLYLHLQEQAEERNTPLL